MPAAPLISVILALWPLFFQYSFPADSAVFASSRIVLRATVTHSVHGNVKYSWQQIDGKHGFFLNDEGANATFVTPAEDGPILFALIMNDGQNRIQREVQLQVQSFATRVKKDPVFRKDHTSQIEVASTSLLPGQIWNRLDSTMEITLKAENSTVFGAFQPRVFWQIGEQKGQELTALFDYSKPRTTLILRPDRAAELQQIARLHPGSLLIEGEDSFHAGVAIIVPVTNCPYRIAGRVKAPGPTTEPLKGLVTLEGAEKGYRAVSGIDGTGGFVFDNLPGDIYALDVGTATGLVGMRFLDLRQARESDISASILLFDASAFPAAESTPAPGFQHVIEAGSSSAGDTVIGQLHAGIASGSAILDVASKIECGTGSGPARLLVLLDGKVVEQRWSTDCDLGWEGTAFYVGGNTFKRVADLRVIVSTAGPRILGGIRVRETLK